MIKYKHALALNPHFGDSTALIGVFPPTGLEYIAASCKATWIESVPIKEVFEGETVWEGVVQVFKVDHPKSKFCYAWSHGLDSSKKRWFFVVLHQGVVNSARAAVKAAIVSEFGKTLKKRKGE